MLVWAAAVVLAAVTGVVIWSQTGVMAAEAAPLAAVSSDDRVSVSESGGSLVLAPADGGSEVGLVFIPGAKVAASAYAAKLADLVVEADVTVVITRPWLNLAFFDLRPLSAFTDAVPTVDTWLVGGHSLGGVRACQLADGADGLVLFASYCAADLSASELPVLSLAGSADGLTTAADIEAARPLLPADATVVVIDGASHSSFGDYGPQAGDGTPTILDAEMTAEIAASVSDLVASLPR